MLERLFHARCVQDGVGIFHRGKAVGENEFTVQMRREPGFVCPAPARAHRMAPGHFQSFAERHFNAAFGIHAHGHSLTRFPMIENYPNFHL